VIGDLLESFQQGRSSEVRHHSVLAIRSIAITLAANYGAIVLGAELIVPLARLPQTHLGLYAVYLWFFMTFLGAAVGGLLFSPASKLGTPPNAPSHLPDRPIVSCPEAYRF
jgi:hypothetical protein